MAEGTTNKSQTSGPAVLTGVVVLLLVVGFAAIAYFGLLRDKWKSERSYSAQVFGRQEILNQLQGIYATKTEHEAKIADLLYRLSSTKGYAPLKGQFSEMMAKILSAAQALGLTIEKMQEGEVVEGKVYDEIGFELKLLGEYPSFVQFLEVLSELKENVQVKNLGLSLAADGQRPIISGTVTMSAMFVSKVKRKEKTFLKRGNVKHKDSKAKGTAK